MKQSSKLKGSGSSISDNLTPLGRANKKILLKGAREARGQNQFKIFNQSIMVNGHNVSFDKLRKSSWLNDVMKKGYKES